MSKWIPVAERQPAPMTDVLIAYRNAEGAVVVDSGFMRHDRRFVYLGMEQVLIPDVFAWMEFPAPPYGIAGAYCPCGATSGGVSLVG